MTPWFLPFLRFTIKTLIIRIILDHVKHKTFLYFTCFTALITDFRELRRQCLPNCSRALFPLTKYLPPTCTMCLCYVLCCICYNRAAVVTHPYFPFFRMTSAGLGPVSSCRLAVVLTSSSISLILVIVLAVLASNHVIGQFLVLIVHTRSLL